MSDQRAILARATLKCQHFRDREYMACLTPAEFVAICDNGAVPNSPSDLKYAREQVAKGQGRGRWYYFKLGGRMEGMVAKPKPKWVAGRFRL